MTEDEALAERLLDQKPAEAPPARRWSEYGIQVELLAAIFDRLAEVVNTIAASSGAKPRKVPPYPRPVTAIERIRQRRIRAKHTQIVARVLPRKAPAVELPSPSNRR